MSQLHFAKFPHFHSFSFIITIAFHMTFHRTQPASIRTRFYYYEREAYETKRNAVKITKRKKSLQKKHQLEEKI